MEMYLFAILIIIVMNALPAFAPPTWMALVFFLLNYDLNPVVLVALGVASATSGRAILAWYFRKFSHLVPTRFSQNMEYAGNFLSSNSSKKYAVLALFLISPISSAQLFEAAGMAKTVPLKPLLAAFAAGRTISYSTYVTGASVIAASSIGEVIIHDLKSPWAIAAQLAMIIAFVIFGSIDWKRILEKGSR
ncbi:unannotated protein [freshwater metagenome]|uniref:Unannotated protein n=1 Tax=freshwater metagenome TaxID=449393 RepID=A0A6J6FQA4_9ZZZZ|nr:hypothetical protein [Actinomycetota bacterium]